MDDVVLEYTNFHTKQLEVAIHAIKMRRSCYFFFRHT